MDNVDKKPVFGLDPDQLDELLSIGSDGIDVSGPESKKLPSVGNIAQDERSGVPNPSAPLVTFVEPPGTRIGQYKLLHVLGEGGMGIVYLTEQERPIKRTVALKIIKPGMDSKRIVARFEAERQALALLDHPNIAHVYDAGATENGRPYFAMEYVEGLPITEHCDYHKLTIGERLNLFLHVCHAVQHAHQKGIIHRDIKPSNILVSTRNEKPVPKIIDFGVAKAISQPLTEKTLFTYQGQLFGTPEYMSPEQADMANENIDTRSDVYSLGVLLYVLLTGVLPFDSANLRKGGVERIRRIIREMDPKTPSTRLTTLGEKAKKVAECRRTAVAALTRCLHKELEWIPLKAMCKERAERYQSASELADDIENYLKGAALIAGPPSTLYWLTKFVRRNLALVTGIAAVLVVLVGGIIVSTVFAFGQARARAEAEQQETVARAVSDFLTTVLVPSASPFDPVGRQAAQSFVQIASESLKAKSSDMPLVEAAIRSALGNAYRMLGDLETCEQYLEHALQVQQQLLGQEHPDTLNTMHFLVRLRVNQARCDEAETLAVKTLETRRRVIGAEHPDTLISMFELAWVYRDRGRYDKAEPLFIETLERMRRVLGEEHIETTTTMLSLGQMYIRQARYDEAERFLTEVWKIRLRTRGEPSALNAMGDLGRLYRYQGRYDEAEAMLLKVLEAEHRVLGEEHWLTIYAMGYLAEVYRDLGRYDEAEPLLLKALDAGRRVFGENHPVPLEYLNNLIDLYEAWDKPQKAAQWRAKLPQVEISEE
jgi:serine/threonine protein kinase/lipopolysaccharide biosynthesis regulator YciM